MGSPSGSAAPSAGAISFSEAAIRFNLNGVWLARDAADEARRDLARTRWTPPGGGYHMQHWYEQHARFEIELYAGEARRGLAAFRPIAGRLMRSLLRGMRIHRVHVRWLHARLLLAAAEAGAGKGEVDEAARIARQLAREDVPYARTYSLLVRAGVAHQRGDDAGCVRLLEGAVQHADDSDYPHCASAARFRLGSILGGSRGSALVTRAREWATDQSIRDPERMMGIWAPGFTGSSSS